MTHFYTTEYTFEVEDLVTQKPISLRTLPKTGGTNMGMVSVELEDLTRESSGRFANEQKTGTCPDTSGRRCLPPRSNGAAGEGTPAVCVGAATHPSGESPSQNEPGIARPHLSLQPHGHRTRDKNGAEEGDIEMGIHRQIDKDEWERGRPRDMQGQHSPLLNMADCWEQAAYPTKQNCIHILGEENLCTLSRRVLYHISWLAKGYMWPLKISSIWNAVRYPKGVYCIHPTSLLSLIQRGITWTQIPQSALLTTRQTSLRTSTDPGHCTAQLIPQSRRFPEAIELKGFPRRAQAALNERLAPAGSQFQAVL